MESKVSPEELNKRKRAHVRFLVLQITAFITGGVLMTMASQDQLGLSVQVIAPIHMVVLIALNIAVYLLVEKFFQRWAKILLASILILSHIIQFSHGLAEWDPQMEKLLGFFGMFTLFLGLLISILTIIKDIFLHKHDLVYSMYGAANIYLGTPVLFTTLYTMLEILEPGIMGIPYTHAGELFLNCYHYSWYVVTGLENPLASSVNSTILSISVFESAFTSLFIIFVVGRLMANK